MAMTAAQQNDSYKFFIIAFGAAPGVEYMNQLNDAYASGMTTQQAVNVYTTKAQFTAVYPKFLTNAQFATSLVNNVVKGTASDAAKAQAVADIVGAMNGGMSRGDVVFTVFNNLSQKAGDATWGATVQLFNNQIAVAKYYTETLLGSATDVATLQSVVSGVTATTDVSSASAIAASFAPAAILALTTGADTVVGTSGNDIFEARIFNNSNTLQSGDKIIGGAGADRLNADIGNSQSFAITAETTSVETIAIRAEAIAIDSNNNNMKDGAASSIVSNSLSGNQVQIDAQRMVGVTQWESNNSRADVVIEDVRILASQITKDITIAMVETDPGHVDMGVYFDQYSLRAQSNSSASLTLQLMDTRSQAAGTGPLKDSPYSGFAFNLTAPGATVAKLVTVKSDAIDNALTYADLVIAINAALKTNPELAAFTATLGKEFTVSDTLGTQQKGTEIVLTSNDGSSVSAQGAGTGWLASGAVPSSSGLHTFISSAQASTTDLVTSKIILDDVGRGSTGGDLVVGGLSVGDTSSSQGVQRFEIEVRDNSKLESINSTNNTLREVTIKNGVTTSTSFAYVETVKDAGNLTVNGNSGKNGANITNGLTTDPQTGAANGQNEPLPGSAAQTARGYGFSDVKTIDANEFKGKLAFSAEITESAVAKYLNLKDIAALPAGDNIAVAYTGGANDDTLFVSLDAAPTSSRSTIVAGREDFTFTTNGGAGNDTITVGMAGGGTALQLNGGAQAWYTNQKLNANVFVNGGDGNDTILTPGAGDKIIDGGAGNDTIYVDNTGALAASTVASGIAGLASLAYRNAAAAELAAAQAAATLAKATALVNALDSNAATTNVVNALATLDAITPDNVTVAPVYPSYDTIHNGIVNAYAANAITAAQYVQLDTAYNTTTSVETEVAPTTLGTQSTFSGYAARGGGTITVANMATGDAVLATIVASAKAALAVATAANANLTTQFALLNGTQQDVVNATQAVNGVYGGDAEVAAGTATIVAGLATLKAALVVGATVTQQVAALNVALKAGVIASGTSIFAAGNNHPLNAADVTGITNILQPLQDVATVNNTAKNLLLTKALIADATAVSAAATLAAFDVINAVVVEGPNNDVFDSNETNDAVGNKEAADAAATAVTAAKVAAVDLASAQAINTALLALKAAVNVGTTDVDVNSAIIVAQGATAAAKSLAVATAVIDPLVGQTTSLQGFAGVGDAAPVTNAQEVTFDTGAGGYLAAGSIDSFIKANTAVVDALAIVVANANTLVTATATAAAIALAAANSGGQSASFAAPRAVFVFDTSNQTSTYNAAQLDDRNLADLKSDVNNTYNFFNSTVKVTYQGLNASVVVAGTGYKTSDLQLNQAIKNAINSDAVLSKLLVATDGPANSLVVTSLIDGVHTTSSLAISVTAPLASSLSAGDTAAAATAYGVAGTAVNATIAAAKAAFDLKGDYVTQFAETGAKGGNVLTVGANSLSSSDNTITGGAGNDVIVLGTTVGTDLLTGSNDKVIFTAGFGNDTVVNFATTGFGIDQLDFTALMGQGNVALNSLSLDKSIVIAAQAPTALTVTQIAALFTDSATAISHVYVAYDATNVGSVYMVSDAAGVAAGNVTASLVGTINLAATSWSTLTAANFA